MTKHAQMSCVRESREGPSNLQLPSSGPETPIWAFAVSLSSAAGRCLFFYFDAPFSEFDIDLVTRIQGHQQPADGPRPPPRKPSRLGSDPVCSPCGVGSRPSSNDRIPSRLSRRGGVCDRPQTYTRPVGRCSCRQHSLVCPSGTRTGFPSPSNKKFSCHRRAMSRHPPSVSQTTRALLIAVFLVCLKAGPAALPL